MNQYATKADMMTDKNAFYKTEKAIDIYRKEVPFFENVWISQNEKAWQIVNLSAQKINDKNKYVFFIIIGFWLVGLFMVMYKMKGVQEALTAYHNMSEIDKLTTGRLGRIFQIVSHFGIAEYSVIALWVVLMVLISIAYGKWMMKKMKYEIANAL